MHRDAQRGIGAGDVTPASEFGIVALASTLLTVALTYPLAFEMGKVGRVDTVDGQFSIWNVAWVARTLIVDPRHVFDANIFYPHRGTLAFSENNLGAGMLALPVYWATRNPYAAYNFVILLGFTLSAIATYYLVRYHTDDRRAAALSAICFAFCPYAFAHAPQIQLELTAGLPFTLLAFHRLADRPSVARGAALGAVMAVQALCCGYYGIFAIWLVGYATCVVIAVRSLRRNAAFAAALGVGAIVAITTVLPAFWPYISLARANAFGRGLEQARPFSANLAAYFASSSYAHRWMLRFFPQWREVLFPGFVAASFGFAGVWLARHIRRGEVVVIYGGAALLAAWASFGPSAGLYILLYKTLPVMSLLRAPARLGIIVTLCLVVLAGVAVATILARTRRANLVAAALIAAAIGEAVIPTQRWPAALPVEPVYQALAGQPRGPVIEMPVYSTDVGVQGNAKYMLTSTAHWMPLVNGYSDSVPADFRSNARALAGFPSVDAFGILQTIGVRYVVVHLYGYKHERRDSVRQRLREFDRFLRPIYIDGRVGLYEITGFPP